MIHLNNLVFDMGGPGNAIILGSRLGGADQDIAHPHLAGIALPVIGGEFFNELADKPVFFIHEHPLPRNEHIVENHQRLMPSEIDVAAIQ